MNLITKIDEGFKRIAELLQSKADQTAVDSITHEHNELVEYLPWLRENATKHSKIYADFVNQTYRKNGKNATFYDVFEFYRSGKAWLITDDGLVEFLDDEPRFDGGLLIEEEATNYLLNSTAYVDEQVDYVVAGRKYRKVGYEWRYIFHVKHLQNGTYLVSTYFSNHNDKTLAKRLAFYNADNSLAEYIKPEITELTSAQFIRDDTKDDQRIYFLTDNNNDDLTLGISYAALTDTDYVTSYIPTQSAPVTRHPDYLFAQIDGSTTVTGDWDDTLEIWIEDGMLMHAGYGKIRTLEIT